MDDEDYGETIRNLILDNIHPAYRASGNKELRVRCPYCGDSQKNASSAHFYIEMNPPFRFHCFKCETSGVLTQQVLRDLGVYDNSAGLVLAKASKDYRTNSGIQQVSFRGKEFNNTPTNSPNAIAAVNYFNKRYESNFTEEELINKFKCVTDAESFFKLNNIRAPNHQYDFSKAIGFISSDNSHIIFRDITNTQQKRYDNLSLYSSEVVGAMSKAYNIPGTIDAMASSVDLVITEGIFDIIGVYNIFYKNADNPNIIFSAACGKSYKAIIMNYIRKGFLNLNIKIYSDADVPISFFQEMKQSSPYLREQTIQVFYNTKSKDYGIPANQIELRQSRI